jgi:hypothetical protein
MWEEKSTPNSRNTPAVFCITGVSDRDPNIMAAFIAPKLPCFKGENKGGRGEQGNSTYFLCAKIPSKSNNFEEKNNRNGEIEPSVCGEEVKEIHSFFLFFPSFFDLFAFAVKILHSSFRAGRLSQAPVRLTSIFHQW